MDLLLNQTERDRFASWLEHEAQNAKGLLIQLEKLGTIGLPIIQREKAEAAAALMIARKLRSISEG